jgi:Insulinase (Peptidase family M16)
VLDYQGVCYCVVVHLRELSTLIIWKSRQTAFSDLNLHFLAWRRRRHLLAVQQAAGFTVQVAAGSRDESAAETGVTLLLQRLAFKATTERSSLRLNRDLQNAGVQYACVGGRDKVRARACWRWRRQRWRRQRWLQRALRRCRACRCLGDCVRVLLMVRNTG